MLHYPFPTVSEMNLLFVLLNGYYPYKLYTAKLNNEKVVLSILHVHNLYCTLSMVDLTFFHYFETIVFIFLFSELITIPKFHTITMRSRSMMSVRCTTNMNRNLFKAIVISQRSLSFIGLQCYSTLHSGILSGI